MSHLPVVAEGLVERSVVVVGDLLRLPHPDRLLLVQVFPLVRDLRPNKKTSRVLCKHQETEEAKLFIKKNTAACA